MKSQAPTLAELAVLRVLWRRGPSTVREVHERVYAETETGYTSSLKIMQNMLGKGLVSRADQAKSHIYAAAVSERSTLNGLVRGWMDSAFAGSSMALAMQALDAKAVSPEELAEFKTLIERLEADKGGWT